MQLAIDSIKELPDVEKLQRALGDRIDGMEIHFGHGVWLALPPVDEDTRLIAETLASTMSADDIRLMIAEVAMADDFPSWLIQRRWVLEKIFDGLVN